MVKRVKETEVIISLSDIIKRPRKKIVKKDIDYFTLYEVIARSNETAYLLDSLTASKRRSKLFTIGFDPIVTISARKNVLTISGHRHNILLLTGHDTDCLEIQTDNPYSFLKKYFKMNFSKSNEFQGGLVGYFSYESINYFEESLELEEHKNFPVFELGLYLDGLVFDSQTKTLNYYTFSDNNRFSLIERYIQLAESNQMPPYEQPVVKKLPELDDQIRYYRSIDDILKQIKEGNTYQCEAGYKSKYNIKGDKLTLYKKLRQINPSPYMYHLKFYERELLGASPEVLVSCVEGVVATTPTAGTIETSSNRAANRVLRQTLLDDHKETAEHNMLVDLHRNDISKVCIPGTVKVAKYKDIIKFSHVQHIVSDIYGTLRSDADAFDVLASILPGGVVTGVPKIETIKIIKKWEREPRGPYGGAVGRFSMNGDCVFCLPIRSLFCYKNECYSQTCSGIVLDSKRVKELQEVVNKLEAMEVALSGNNEKN